MSDTEKILIFLIIVVIGIVLAVRIAVTIKVSEPSCNDLRNTEVQYLPARCLTNFNGK